MWIKKLTHKKKQFFLVGLMLMIISAVFCTCIAFTWEMKQYANVQFSKEYCPDVYVYSLDNTNEKENFPPNVRNNIKSIYSLKGKTISVPIVKGENTIPTTSTTTMFCNLEDTSFSKFIKIVEGDRESAEPSAGEIWIVQSLASSYKIALGDTITMDYKNPIKLKVTALYTSTFAPTERLTIYPNIVNGETISLLKDESAAGVFALELIDNTERKISELSQNNPYAIQTFDKKILKNYVTGISGVLGIVSTIAAAIIFFATLFIIRFLIENDLKKELRLIGTYKSLGYSSKQIKTIYMKAYVVVGIISIGLGVLTSTLLTYYLCTAATQVLGGFALSGVTTLACILVVAMLIILLYLGLLFALNRVEKITPIEAISKGQNMGVDKLPPSLIQNASSSFAMAINDIFKHKKSSFTTWIVLTISVYLILFFASAYDTCGNIYKNANKWVGVPTFDVLVSGELSTEIARDIASCEHVEGSLLGNAMYYPKATIPQFKGNEKAVSFIVLNDTQEDKTGISIQEGYNPRNNLEISVSENFLQSLNMKLGDILQIGVDNKMKDFLISGTFSSLEAPEGAIMMTIDGMKSIDENYIPSQLFIGLKAESNFEILKEFINKNYNELSVEKEWTAVKMAVSSIETMLTNVMLVMLIVFILFVTMIIINLLFMTVGQKQRQYGILKSLGFTTGYIIRQNVYHILLLFLTGTITAILFHLAFSKRLFAALVIDALIVSSTFLNILILGITLLVIMITLAFTVPIRKITPVYLMEE